MSAEKIDTCINLEPDLEPGTRRTREMRIRKHSGKICRDQNIRGSLATAARHGHPFKLMWMNRDEVTRQCTYYM